MPLKNSEEIRASLGSFLPDNFTQHKEDSSFRAQLARIMHATAATNDADLARALGISQPSVWGVKNKGKIPDSWIKKVANKYAVSTDWLYKGGPDYKYLLHNVLKSVLHSDGHLNTNKEVEELVTKLAIKDFAQFNNALEQLKDNSNHIDKYVHDNISEPHTAPVETHQPTTETDVDMMFVPLVEARLSAGTGSLETSADGERKYAFRSDFLHRKGSPSKMVLMRVSGDSMEPEIKDGDVVLLDQGKTTILPGRMYAVGIEEAIYVKQIDTIPGKLILKSMNQAYPPIEVDMRGDLAEQARVIGQVLWVGREYR
jgi:Predicted transcriptional regulator